MIQLKYSISNQTFMLKRSLLNWIIVILLTALSTQVMGQGVTTASMSGRITGGDGEGLPGATVVAVHTPSGTQFATGTREDGRFNFPNLRVGGPYEVTVTFIGFQEQKRGGINLSLGQNFTLDLSLQESNVQLGEVTVTAERDDIMNADRTGAATNISNEQINALPTVGRNLTDFTRLTPQAVVTPNGGISLAGANNRFNSIFIDGAVNNDVFGLSETGTNGGQANSISPISIDAIEEFQVVLAPFDVRLGGFAGGGINAVTRSGSNTFSGSLYGFYRNQDLAGKTPTDNPAIERTKLSEFNAYTTGFRLGGPILKNKLFFFVNLEIQREKTPQPFDINTYQSASKLDDINNLVNFVRNTYQYDPGSFLNNPQETKANRGIVRLDWNINQQHKLTLRHSYTKGEAYKRTRSSTSTINFGNNSEFFPSTTNSSALELKSSFGSSLSNDLILGFTRVVDDRDAIGADFPRVTINDGTGRIIFGTEPFSTGNQLKTTTFTLTDNVSLYKGRHTILGTHNEFYSVYNLFIGNNYGAYTFANLNSFLTGGNSTDFEYSYSLLDDKTGDGSKAAADFDAMQLGFYAQDEFNITDRLKLTGGIRADIPFFLNKPIADENFNNVVVPQIEAAGYDLEGARVGKMPTAKVMLSPRLGFNYDVKGDRSTQLRGGVGIFTSRVPFVWPGASYNNNGLLIGAVPSALNPKIPLNPDPYNQPEATALGSTTSVPSGDINVFAPDFKFPQIARATLAIDQRLPWNLIGTLEGIYTKTLNNVTYYNFNVPQPTATLAGQDNRPRYDRSKPISSTYRHILLGTNTNKGYSYNLTAQLQKSFEKGFTANVSYTFGRSKVINEGTSSQNSSQWRFNENVRGKNDLDLTYSDFDLGSRIVAAISYRKEYLKHFATTLSLFYTGQSGNRFSYIYQGSLSNDDPQGGFTDSDLLYVPRNYATYSEALDQGEIRFTPINNSSGAVVVTPEQQWLDLNTFIANDEYLNSRRGQYAERNGSRLPFTNVIDLRLLQDFFLETNGTKHTLQLSLDVFNFTNLLNKDWGRQYFLTNDNYRLIQYVNLGNDNRPNFQFNKPSGNIYNIDDSGFNSSRWQAQVGVRYSF